jgi:hypothetical protein
MAMFNVHGSSGMPNPASAVAGSIRQGFCACARDQFIVTGVHIGRCGWFLTVLTECLRKVHNGVNITIYIGSFRGAKIV